MLDINYSSIADINSDIIKALNHVKCALGHLCNAVDALEYSLKIKKDLDEIMISNKYLLDDKEVD